MRNLLVQRRFSHFLNISIVPLLKSGIYSVLTWFRGSVALWFSGSVLPWSVIRLVSAQYLDNQWTKFDQILYAHQY